MASVLWFSNETPDVGGQGGQRRQYFQIQSLVDAGHEVSLVTLGGPQDDRSVSDFASVLRLPQTGGRFQRAAGRTNSEALRELRSSRHDCVVVSHIESWMYLKKHGIEVSRPRLLDLHNVFSAWYEAQGKRWTSERWGRWEVQAARDFDELTVCSNRERTVFSKRVHREPLVLPHGIAPSEWSYEPRPAAVPVIKLFGKWDWSPNREGLDWFLGEVVPETLALVPELRIEIAGTGFEISVPSTRVSLVGRVPDLARFLSDAWVVGVPVRNGVGAPVKFAEGLATGVPLAATDDASDGSTPEAVLVSNDARQWARWIADVVVDDGQAREAASRRRAETLIQRSWSAVNAPLSSWVATQ